MSNSYGVDNAINKVPQYLKEDPGLEFDRLRWRNRRGRLDGSSKFYIGIQLKLKNKWFVLINGGIKEKVL